MVEAKLLRVCGHHLNLPKYALVSLFLMRFFYSKTCKVFSSSKTVWINYHPCLYLILLPKGRIMKLMVKSWKKQNQDEWIRLTVRTDKTKGYVASEELANNAQTIAHRTTELWLIASMNKGCQIFLFFKEPKKKNEIFVWKLMVIKCWQQISFLSVCVVTHRSVDWKSKFILLVIKLLVISLLPAFYNQEEEQK